MCLFLAEYGVWLLGSGATCIRLEKNMKRIAASADMEVEITIMPRHLHLTVWSKNHRNVFTTVATVKNCPISFYVNSRLSTMSWEIADGRLSIADAYNQLDSIVRSDSQNPWLLLLLVALANASFCRLFGGDFIAMGVVAIATAAGYFMKINLMRRHVDIRIIMIVCAFVSTVIGATDYLFGLGSTPMLAVGTSVLYLVPGIPFLNSFSDMLYRHYICAFSRFMDAVVLTGCLSIGLCLGLWLMRIGMF
ncbi:MAG: threonine/serine exporter family protein [Muribaculaceae bacterium]|nr:threonine/serine exporter family protein [Muribaculaceae bacterium]